MLEGSFDFFNQLSLVNVRRPMSGSSSAPSWFEGASLGYEWPVLVSTMKDLPVVGSFQTIV